MSKYPTKQIKVYLTESEAVQVDEIVKDYGFRSRFELGKCLLMIFVKAFDPKENEFIPENLRFLVEDYEKRICR